MPRFDVAHLREQGQDMVIIPLESSFGNKTSQDQQAIIVDLQIHSRSAGLAGIVVPVWDSGGGRMAFIAPHQWHPFFSSLSLQWVFANINKYITW
jgi:hypothetical protein